MDIKAEVSKIVEKVTSDKDLMSKFQSDPVKTVEGIIGVDLPDDVVNQVVSGVKAKVSADKISGGIDAIKKLF